MSRKSTRPDYAAYIASDAWQRVRRAYFRSGLPTTCQALHDDERCGRLKVDLHHWTYKRLGREKPSDLIPLCRECHDRVHAEARDNSAEEIKRATQVVCGRNIFQLQRARTQPDAPPPPPAPIKALRAEARPAPPSAHEAVELRQELEALGRAIRNGQTGKQLRFRLARVAKIARLARREDIARAVESYKGVGRVPDRVVAAIKPWDTTRRKQQGQLGKAARQVQRRRQRAARR